MTKTTESQSPQQQIETEFPAYAWMLSEPGVLDALSNTDITSSDQFTAAIQNTEWWKTTEPSRRSYEQLQAQDPPGLSQQLGREAALVNDAFSSMGITSDPEAQTRLATQALQLGWSASQLNDAVVTYARQAGNVDYKNQAGALQTSVTQLQAEANKYLIPLDNGTAQSWATQIAAGEKNINDYTALLQQQAKTKYANSPDIVNALNQGLSTDDALSSYKTDIAKLLNLGDSSQVDFMNNPLYSKILNYTDPASGQSRVMSYGEMENYVRATPQYDHTPGAIQQAADIGQSILQTFGKVG